MGWRGEQGLLGDRNYALGIEGVGGAMKRRWVGGRMVLG